MNIRTRMLAAIVVAVVVVSCDDYDNKTMAELYDEVVAEYGEPEEVYEYNNGGYHSMDLWYWSQGFCVTLVVEQYGWEAYIDSWFYFPPISSGLERADLRVASSGCDSRVRRR